MIVMRIIPGRAENRTPDLDLAARYLVTDSLFQGFESRNMFVDYSFLKRHPFVLYRIIHMNITQSNTTQWFY